MASGMFDNGNTSVHIQKINKGSQYLDYELWQRHSFMSTLRHIKFIRLH